MQKRTVCWLLGLWGIVSVYGPMRLEAQTLDTVLAATTAEEWAEAARTAGDARRGAVLFYQPYLACRTCHHPDSQGRRLGPDLTKWDEVPTDAHLVEAVLDPSKSIRKGYESLTVVTSEGKTFTGLIVSDDDPLVLQDATQPGRTLRFARNDLDEVVRNTKSIMPPGLAKQLSSKQQFLDLIRYLLEIRDGGSQRARALEPPPHLYAAPPLPEYEKQIDHAGFLQELGPENFARGEAIYNRLCVNCHGTPEQPGSLPTSLRFATGQFKNGADPYTMYQTLTRGFGMMQPQTWMVPQQKYDVIHYIREAYLKPLNPSQYVPVDDVYLAGLPPGDVRGPSPQTLEPWVTMDYGDSLINTYETGDDGANFAYKGIAVRLDPGPGGVSRGRHWMILDHDTLRMSAAWSGTGFIDWNGIHFNGRHNSHPRLVGDVRGANPAGPGWAHPETGSFEDVRLVGRDDRRYGPLPRDWAHYRGLYFHGDQRVISYTVGQTEVLESPKLLTETPVPVFARRIQVGPRPRDLSVEIVTHDDTAAAFRSRGDLPAGNVALVAELSPVDAGQAESQKFQFDGKSFAELEASQDCDLTSHDFTIRARIRTKSGGTIFAKTSPGAKWVPDGKALFVRGGRLCYDIGWVGVVTSNATVNDGKWHDVAMTWEHETGAASLFIDGRLDKRGTLRPKQPREDQVVRLGFAAPDFPGPESHFRGEIEFVEFFDRQVAAAPGAADRPVARWEPAQAEGDRIADASGHDRAAVIRRGESSSENHPVLLAGLTAPQPGLAWQHEGGALRLQLPAGEAPLAFTVWWTAVDGPAEATAALESVAGLPRDTTDLTELTHGGPSRWTEPIVTQPEVGDDAGPFAADVLTRPVNNPWFAQVRLTGFDFFADGDTAAVCSWDGDVWRVRGVDGLDGPLEWRRIASGLFQPLGLKIVDGTIYVTCRDQLVILRDLNGDGETDFYENFNNDHQVTEHFHEFAMGLQRDEAGNFYYAKSARHALTAIVPHHGTLLRVSPDGKRTDILATGFRAANGVCLNPDGTFIVTDQEGHWNPKNRINWVREGGFYGNMFGYHDVTDASNEAMEQPLCWITNAFDRSPAELLWVPRETWGPLGGALLNLSYGYGKVFVVPHEQIDGQMQGGMCELPLPQFPTGLIRGRFHPGNGQLYACGMFAWAGNQQQPGGMYRIRRTGRPMDLPIALHARREKLMVRFTDPLDAETARDPANWLLTAWDLKRTANYGSPHLNEREWAVTGVSVSEDGRTVELTVPELAPTWGMEIRCFLKSKDGRDFERRIHNTIHHLAP